MKIHLIRCGINKIAAVKAIRMATGLSLKDAKRLADTAPSSFNMAAGSGDLRGIIQDLRDSGSEIRIDTESSVIDKVTAASYISTAEIALGEGNATECRNCLRSALRLLGDFPDDVNFLGITDM